MTEKRRQKEEDLPNPTQPSLTSVQELFKVNVHDVTPTIPYPPTPSLLLFLMFLFLFHFLMNSLGPAT